MVGPVPRACREWNTFAEEPAAPKTKGGSSRRSAREVREPVTLKGIEADSEGRISTGMSELDQVLGGGIVPGSLVLVGGDPGIGKSTLLLQVCRNLAERLTASYISPGRNHCSRSSFVRCGSESSLIP